MEDKNQYDELLVRYLFNEETGEEKVSVENWLNASEENQAYFNRLKKVLQLTQIKQHLDYLTDEENLDKRWDLLKQNITEKEGAKIISLHEQEHSGDNQLERKSPVLKPKLYRLLVSAAVAASVLLVIGLGWKFFAGNKQELPVVQNTERKPNSLQFVVRHEANTTGKEKRIQLSDGSLIVLANNSEITYKEPFIDKRDITLTGKAYFKVAHDKTRPFTVTSDDISTTALGTEFSVTAFSKTNQIIVRLYEGKVVVKAVDKANKKMNSDVYLLAGQEFVYNGQTMAKVRAFTLNKHAAPEQIINQEMNSDNPFIPQTNERSWYMFNNQALPQVFDQLSRMFKVEIVYNKKEIQNMYFIGKYNNADSLQTILKRIATLNNLTITNKDNKIIISR